MSLREAYERRKAERAERRAKPKPEWSQRDIITTTLSIAAFVVSLTTTYFTVIRQVEEVNVTFYKSGGIFRLMEEPDHLGISSNAAEMIFINSGKVAVVILEVQMTVFHLKDDAKQGCSAEHSHRTTTFDTDFEPTTLKASDVKRVRVTLTLPKDNTHDRIEPYNDDQFKFPVAKENAQKNRFFMSICADVTISSPTIRREREYIPGVFVTLKDVEYAIDSPPAARDFSKRFPKNMYRRTGTIFD